LIEKYVFITVYLFLSRSLGFKTSNKTILTRALIEKSVVLLGLKTELATEPQDKKGILSLIKRELYNLWPN
jgi:hypothetical protein